MTPTIEAVVWLLEALRYGDEQGGKVMAHLALMYGVTRRTYKMLRCVRDALAATHRSASIFLLPVNSSYWLTDAATTGNR